MRTGIKAASAVALIAGLVLAPAALAAAHDKVVDGDCDSLDVSLTNYDRGATALIVADGVTLHEGTFDGRLVTSYPITGNTEHTYSVLVKSNDGERYGLDWKKTTSGCYTPPPTPLVVTADFTATDAKCVEYDPTGNAAEVSYSDGVTASYTRDGGAPIAVTAGSYDDSAIVPGAYVVTFTAPTTTPVSLFPNGEATLVFQHTFVAPPTDCTPDYPGDKITHEDGAPVTVCGSLTSSFERIFYTSVGAFNKATGEFDYAEPIESGRETVTRNLTDDEIVAECTPPAKVQVDPFRHLVCARGGFVTYEQTTTTPYIWDSVAREFVEDSVNVVTSKWVEVLFEPFTEDDDTSSCDGVEVPPTHDGGSLAITGFEFDDAAPWLAGAALALLFGIVALVTDSIVRRRKA